MKNELVSLKEQEKLYYDQKVEQMHEFNEIASKARDSQTDLIIALEVILLYSHGPEIYLLKANQEKK